MGLLTDPGVEKSRIISLFYSYHQLIVCFCYIIGILWFGGLAHNSLNHGTYFSENALLPGLVRGEFMGDSDAHNFLQALEGEAEKHPSDVPYAWLISQFTQLGLDTYTHNFSIKYPMAPDKVFKGKNVYAILRSIRGSSTESLVVSAPYRPPNSVHQGTSASIALMLALAKFFAEQVYWAKDIIFLITEHEQLGAQAWLEAYHRSACGAGFLNSGDLPARAGPIQAGINLEIADARISHIDVKIEGLNGQLPNLDLVNLIHRLCYRENVHHTFKNMDDHPNPESFKGWIHQLKTLVAMVSTQATGIPNGNHGLFHRFGIAAVTIEGVREDGRKRRLASLLQLGRVLEGICRSLNNLLERFHQSFFFYLLPSTNRYISIGVYMLPFGLLGGSLLVVALALWYSTSSSAMKQSADIREGKIGSDKIVNYSLASKVPVMVCVHLIGLALSYIPYQIALFGAFLEIPADDAIILTMSAVSLAFLSLPFILKRALTNTTSSWEVLKCIVVLELSAVFFAVSVYNISLAFVATAIYAPIAITVAPTKSRFGKLVRSIILLACHPLALLYFFVLLDTIMTFGINLTFSTLIWKSFIATKRALTFSIVDGLIYGNWVFEATCLCIVPAWLVFWIITHYALPEDYDKKKKD